MRQTFAAAWALGLTTLAFAQGTQATIAAYDARALLRSFDPMVPAPRLPLQEAFLRGAAQPGAGAGSARILEEEPLLAIVRTAVRVQGADVSISAGQVFVKGPPAAHEAVAAVMNYLGRTLLQQISVEVYALPAAPDTPSGVLTSAEADRVVGTKTPAVELARTSGILGQPARARAGRAISFVGDYDVEVANGAAIADPTVQILQEGLDFSATVGQAADGRLLVRFRCTRAALAEPIASRGVGSTRVGDIQLPKVRTTVVVGSGLVEDGGALAVRHDGGLGSGMLVRVRRASPPPPASSGADHSVIFADDLLGRPVRLQIPSVRDDLRRGDPGQSEGSMLEEPWDGGSVPHELMEGFVRTALGEDSATFDITGTRIHMGGPEAAAARVRVALAGLAKGFSRNFAVEFRIGKTDLAGQPLTKSAEELAPKLSTLASVVSSSSDQFLVAAGIDQSVIIDHDPEIAEKSEIADPIIGILFDGYVISGVASAPTADRIELALDLQHQALLPLPSAGFPLRTDNVGPLDLPQVDTAGGRYRLLLEPGKWTLVSASSPSEGSAFVVLARARWQ